MELITNNKYFSPLNEFHHEVVKPYREKIKFIKPIQGTFWGMENCSHVMMGLFYETLTAALFGGKLIDSVIRNDLDIPYSDIKPDIINGKIAYESKACRQGHQLNLLDDQINRYRVMQILKPTYQIYFVVWRHTLKKIRDGKLTLSEMIKYLSENTKACLILPLSVIWTLFKSPLLTRYETDLWPYCSRWNSKHINEFIFDPLKRIDEIGLEPLEFGVSRRITPNTLYFEGQQITPIPITMVKHYKYFKWIKDKFLDEIPF